MKIKISQRKKKLSLGDSSEINNLDQNQDVEKNKFLDSAYQSYLVQKYDIDIRKNKGKYFFQNKSYDSLIEVYEQAYELDLLEDKIKEQVIRIFLVQLLVQLIFTMKKMSYTLIKKIINKTSEHGFGVRVPTRPPKKL